MPLATAHSVSPDFLQVRSNDQRSHETKSVGPSHMFEALEHARVWAPLSAGSSPGVLLVTASPVTPAFLQS